MSTATGLDIFFHLFVFLEAKVSAHWKDDLAVDRKVLLVQKNLEKHLLPNLVVDREVVGALQLLLEPLQLWLEVNSGRKAGPGPG